jgi:hypothetical protein
MVNMGVSKDYMIDHGRIKAKLSVHGISLKAFALEHTAVEKDPFS